MHRNFDRDRASGGTVHLVVEHVMGCCPSSPTSIEGDLSQSDLPLMATGPTFRFMALPPEPRCHVYTFLPEMVYKSVFPAIDRSRVGTPCWPLYRMPSSLLQTSKAIHEEVKGITVQNALRTLNDHYPPTIVLGPYFQAYPNLFPLTFAFYGIASGKHSPPEDCLDSQWEIQFISESLAEWYNDGLPNTFCRGTPPRATSRDDSNSHYTQISLHSFVQQTLKRMRNSQVTEVHLRLLIRGNSLRGNRMADQQILRRIFEYTVILERGEDRRNNAVNSRPLFTLVWTWSIDKAFYNGALRYLKRRPVPLKEEQPSSEDQRFFNKPCSYDHPLNYANWN